MSRDIERAKNAKYDYLKDKKGWVTFSGGRKKMKLRAYVSEVVKRIVKATGESRLKARENVIDSYNKGGLKGIGIAMKVYAEQAYKKETEQLDKVDLKL